MGAGDNSEIVRAALLAQNRGEDESFRAALDPDVVWEAGPNTFGLPPLMRGPDEVVRAARGGRPGGRHLVFTLYEIREDDDDVLVLGALADTQGMTVPRAWIWRLRGGRAVHVRAFNSHQAALRAWEEPRSSGSAPAP